MALPMTESAALGAGLSKLGSTSNKALVVQF